MRTTLLAAAALLAGCVSAGLPRADPDPVPLPGGGASAPDAGTARPSHASASGFLATHFSRRAWDENVGEGYFGTTDPLVPAGLALSALLVRPGDRSLSRREAGRWGDRPRIGDAGMDLLVAGSVLTGLLAPGKGRTAGDETWSQAEAYALSLSTTTLLKVAVNRRRPGGGGDSFPSGHATAAFTAATLLWRNSGPGVGIPACAVAAATAFSRVEAGRHYPSDVLAGAAIGVLAAGIVDALHFGGGRGKGGGGIDLVPLVSWRPRGFEAGVLIRF